MLARLTAGQRGAEEVDAEDLLIALILEDQGQFPEALSKLHNLPSGVPEAGLRYHQPFFAPDLANELLAQMQALRPRAQPVPNDSDLPVSENVQRIFTIATNLRDALQQSSIEPLHLLLAALEDTSSQAAHMLRAVGITREDVLMAIQKGSRELGNAPAVESPFTAGPSWGRARLVLALAGLRAWTRGAATIKTEDALAALVMEDQGEAEEDVPEICRYPDLLTRLQAKSYTPFLSPDLARRLLAELAALQRDRGEERSMESRTRCVGIASPELLSQPPPPYALVPMSENTSRAFHAADKLRAELHHSELQPMHLLAALLEDDSSRGTEIFRQAGITREKIIQSIRNGT
jgi:ATP-dependent Clp protease ATP-binding subunit ClpA